MSLRGLAGLRGTTAPALAAALDPAGVGRAERRLGTPQARGQVPRRQLRLEKTARGQSALDTPLLTLGHPAQVGAQRAQAGERGRAAREHAASHPQPSAGVALLFWVLPELASLCHLFGHVAQALGNGLRVAIAYRAQRGV